MTYTVNRNGQHFGPYTLEELRTHLRMGSILPSDLVWSTADQRWIALSEYLSATAPPPPFPTAAPPPPPFTEPEAAPTTFGQLLHQATPHAFLTSTLIAINVAVFLLMCVQGASPTDPTSATLIQWGADYGPLTTHGEWWRILTSMFVHVGAIHIAMNMYVLYGVGKFTERLFGNFCFLVLYVGSGLGGSLASEYLHPEIVSAGASGAIFGLYGGLLAFLLTQRHTIPAAALKSIGRNAVFFIVLNLGLGAMIPGIDVTAHLGGLLTGFVIGVITAQPLARASAGSRFVRGAAATILCAAIATGAIAGFPQTTGDPLIAVVTAFSNAEKDSIAGFNRTLKDWKAGKVSGGQFSASLESQFIPELDEMTQNLASAAVSDRQKPFLNSLRSVLQTRRDAWLLYMKGAAANDTAALSAAADKLEESNKVARAFKTAYAEYRKSGKVTMADSGDETVPSEEPPIVQPGRSHLLASQYWPEDTPQMRYEYSATAHNPDGNDVAFNVTVTAGADEEIGGRSYHREVFQFSGLSPNLDPKNNYVRWDAEGIHSIDGPEAKAESLELPAQLASGLDWNDGEGTSRDAGLEDVSIDDKTYKGCLVIKHYDPSSGEEKGIQYFAPGIGLVKQILQNGPAAQGATISLTLRSYQQ